MRTNKTNQHKFISNYDSTKDWLTGAGIDNFKIDRDTLVVDVDGDVNINDMNLIKIPVKFGKVTGWFNVKDNARLASLVGCPDSAKVIYCSSTAIKNFYGIGETESVYADDLSNLESFSGLPNTLKCLIISKSCYNIESLDHFPTTITQQLYIGHDFKMIKKLPYHMDRLYAVGLRGRLKNFYDLQSFLLVPGLRYISSDDGNRDIVKLIDDELEKEHNPDNRNWDEINRKLFNIGYLDVDHRKY